MIATDAAAMVVPGPIGPGAVVRVVAPASPCDEPLAWRAIGWLASRYRVRFSRRIFARSGYLAGDDESRLVELQQALDEPDVGAIICTRGGYGLARIVHRLDWRGFGARPRWVVGFSDITALHVELGRLGVASVHGPNLTSYGRGDERARGALVSALEGPARERQWPALRTLRPGRGSGPLFGGNLSILHACAAAGRLRVPRGAVLLLEEVGERPYRLDRMLTTLAVGGYLDEISAVVLGEFCRCDAGPDAASAAEVLADCLGRLEVPVASGLPVGHGDRNEPLILGAAAHLVAARHEATLAIG